MVSVIPRSRSITWLPIAPEMLETPIGQLLEVSKDLELFHTKRGIPYAAARYQSGKKRGRRLWLFFEDKTLGSWISGQFLRRYGCIPVSHDLQQVLRVLYGLALSSEEKIGRHPRRYLVEEV